MASLKCTQTSKILQAAARPSQVIALRRWQLALLTDVAVKQPAAAKSTSWIYLNSRLRQRSIVGGADKHKVEPVVESKQRGQMSA